MDELWSDVVKRSTYREEKEVKKKRPGQDWKTDKKNSEERKKLEKAAVSALRLGDVKKALRTLHSAPIAPKGEATKALEALHPSDGGAHCFNADSPPSCVLWTGFRGVVCLHSSLAPAVYASGVFLLS